MRDLIVLGVLTSLLPACYRRPFVGLLVFSWLAYMRVQDLSWGSVRTMRWSFYVALLTFAGFVGKKNRGPFFAPDPRCYVMLLLVVLGAIGLYLSPFANARAFSRFLEFVKIIAIALFTTSIVKDKERLRVMLWVIALSLGFHGIKSGLSSMAGGGGLIKRGPGGMLEDNNDFALALSMSVPMLFHLGWSERRQLIRRAFWFAFPMTVITVALTRSRGGFLSVTMALGVLIWRSKNRMHGIAAGILTGILALAFMPADYKERLETIRNPTEEGSAASRLRAWGIATRMALDNPIMGVGFAMFPKNFLRYCEDPSPQELEGKGLIVAHSSYFQIWAEFGTPALVLYLSLIFTSFVTIWRIRKMARHRYQASWILNYATLFEASLVAFVVGSAFINRAHFDLFYQWVALVIAFGRIAREEMTNEAPVLEESGQRGAIDVVRQPGFGRRPDIGGFRPVAG